MKPAAHDPGRAADRLPFAVVGFDAALRVTEWGGRAERLLGRAPDEALGRSVAELLPVVDGEASWRALLVDDDDAPPVALEHSDGRAWEWVPVPVRDASGRAVAVVCYGRERTAAIAAARQAELEHVMLRIMLDNLPVIACVYAKNGEYLFNEGKGLEALGIGPGQLVGMDPFEVFADSPDALEFVRRGLAGVPTPGTTLYERGRWLQSWHIPAPKGGRAALVNVVLDISEGKQREQELLEKIETIERQQQVIRQLSTPIIEVWDGVLALPIIGLVDSVRTAEIMESLLVSVGRLHARFAILDMTGVEVVDTATANHLIGMIRAVRLLGAEGVLTGIHPGIAQTIVMLGIDLREITVHATLRQALVYCIERKPR